MDVTDIGVPAAHVDERLAGDVITPRVEREIGLRRTLALADAAGATAAIASATVLFATPLVQAFWAFTLLPMWILLARLHGLYHREQRALRHLTVDEIPALALWAATGTGFVAVVLRVVPAGGPLSAGSALRIWAVATAATAALRGAIRIGWRRVTPPERAVIVGDGPAAAALRRKLDLFPDIHVRIVDQRATLMPTEAHRGAAWLKGVDRVFCAGALEADAVRALARACRELQLRLSVVPPFVAAFGTAVQLNHVADLPVIEYSTWHVSRSTLFLKRIIDLVVSGILLVALSPVFLLIAVAVLLDSGRPILFRQVRATTGGRPFWIIKFRTMVPEAEALLPTLVDLDDLDDPMFKIADDPRRTRVGRVLRRLSLDELPQLINVVAGDMSLVGPRPEQVELVARYPPEHQFRLTVKPGITGPMQVYGRARLTFDERLALERDYVENLSLGRDLRIIALTMSAICAGRGAF